MGVEKKNFYLSSFKAWTTDLGTVKFTMFDQQFINQTISFSLLRLEWRRLFLRFIIYIHPVVILVPTNGLNHWQWDNELHSFDKWFHCHYNLAFRICSTYVGLEKNIFIKGPICIFRHVHEASVVGKLFIWQFTIV